MSRAPSDLIRISEAEAKRLTKLYMEAELEILREVDRAMARGNDLRYLRGMLDNVQAILEDLLTGNRQWCEQAIPRIYIEGAKFADELAGKAVAGFGAVHQQAVKVLADNTFDRLESVRQVIGRRVEDVYRRYALETTRQSIIGYKTWQQVSRDFRDNLRAEGITGFTDAASRQWNMKTYADMVARTTTMEAHLTGTANRLLEHGHDLVKVSTHAGACEMCQPWQDRILSLTGATPGYPTLEEARAAGLFHPNCRHAYGLHIDLDAEVRALESELGEKQSLDGNLLPKKAENGSIKVTGFRSLGGGVSKTYVGTVDGKRYVFKADEVPPVLSMTRSNLEAELLAEKVLNHLGVPAPKADYREFDAGDGQKKSMLRVEFVEDGVSPAEFLERHDWLDVIDKALFRKMQAVDVLIGNGDRHGNNFFMADDGKVIPIDHNLAFATDMVMKPSARWQKNFLSDLSNVGRTQDIMDKNDIGRAIRARTSAAEYKAVARDIQGKLTDAAIDEMVGGLPDRLADDARKAELSRILKLRRDGLADMLKNAKGR